MRLSFTLCLKPIDKNPMFDHIAQTIPYQQITVEGFEISIKRLDLVHPHISGNKFFKLKYNLLCGAATRL